MTSRSDLEPLSAALRRASEALSRAEPPPWKLPAPAAASSAASLQPRPAARRRWILAPALGACVAVLLASTLLLLSGRDTVPAAHEQRAHAGAFITVVGQERWAELVADGGESAWLVSTELPGDRLAALGLPYDPGRAGERVRAELLMHASGDVLAVRLLH